MNRILHIANDYAGSTVYMNLVRELDELELEQIVYTAVRDKKSIGKNLIGFNNKVSQVIFYQYPSP